MINDGRVAILMWTDDAFASPYIVTARTRLEAAKIVAAYRNEHIDAIKRRYTPIELNRIVRISSDDIDRSVDTPVHMSVATTRKETA